MNSTGERDGDKEKAWQNITLDIPDEIAAQQCNITFCVNRTRSLNNICFYV